MGYILGTFLRVLIASELAVLCWGVFLCYKVRNVPTLLNEGKHIAFSIYNTLLVASVVVGLIVGTELTPDILFAFVGWGIFLICTATVTVLFVPKMLAVAEEKEKTVASPSRKSVSKTAISSDSAINLADLRLKPSSRSAGDVPVQLI